MLPLKDQCLWTRYLQGEIAFGAPNLRRDSCRLCVGVVYHGEATRAFVGGRTDEECSLPVASVDAEPTRTQCSWASSHRGVRGLARETEKDLGAERS